MKKRLFSLLLAVLMLCSLAPGASAALSPALSGNVQYQSYHDNTGMFSRWAMPVWSYLHPCTEGMERVEYIPHGSGVKLIAEQYTADGTIVGRKEIPIELPIFGGFFAGRNENFIVFGREQSTKTGDDSEEVIRVVRYSKTWERIDSVSILGNNTIIPFDAGALRMTEDGMYLYVHTCHEMYQSSSGVNHQANLTFVVRKSDLTVTDIRSSVMNSAYGYVSHSFNQFVVLDEGKLVTLDHGDAGPRAAYLYRCAAADGDGKCLPSFYNGKSGEGISVMTFQGEIGNNPTGANLGGLAATSTHYLVAGSSVDQTAEGVDLDDGQRNVFLAAVPKDNFTAAAVRIDWLTDYAEDLVLFTPQLVQVSRDRCLLLWCTGEGMHYVFLKADGTPEGPVFTADASLSDCAPTVIDGKVWWYSTEHWSYPEHSYFVYFGNNYYDEDGAVPTFYCIDPAQPGTVGEIKAQNEPIPPHEHQIIVRNAVEPTCGDLGYTGDKVCSICGEVLEEGSKISALGHNWVTNGAKKETCEEDGSTGRTVCARCGYVLRESTVIPALGHQLEWRNCIEPTCTEPGYSGDTCCRRCDKLLEHGSAMPALGHDWNEGILAAEPTLTHDGVWRYTCKRCGDIHDEPIPRLDCEHDYQDTVVAPTCTQEGYTRHVCRFCGAEYRDSFTAPTHSPVRRMARNAHCESEGYTGDLVCSRCGLLLEAGEVIPALGHKSVVRNAQAPTCTRTGWSGESYCERCNKYLSDGEEVPALGHSWGAWKVTKPATTEAEGEETRTCERCGETVTRALAKLKPGQTPVTPEQPCDGGSACPSRVFTDVDRSADCWYHLAVDWAVTNKVTTGLTATTFGPGASCTRGQMVTFLWRAKGSPEPKRTSNPFVDVAADAYFYKPVLWALENGITTGTDAKHFSPNATVTRAQTVTFLWRLEGRPQAKTAGGFTDVPSREYFAAAVDWAVEQGITNGVGGGKFAPGNNCTRAQIVTFLHRDLT